MTGTIKPTDTAVAAIARASPEQRPQLAQALRVTKDEKRRARSERARETAARAAAVQPSIEETTSAPPSPGRFKSSREELQEISRISDGMLAAESEVSPEIYLNSVEGTVMQMLHICNQLFHEYPCLLSEPVYREKVLKIMQIPKKFILDLERSHPQ